MREIINICIDIEKTMEQIYRALAVLHRDHEFLAHTWESLADDEAQHATQLELASRLLREELLDHVTLGRPQVIGMQEKAGRILERCRNNVPVPPKVALQLTLSLEKEFQVVHLSRVACFTDQNTKNMFAAMARGDEQHIRELETCLQAYESWLEQT